MRSFYYILILMILSGCIKHSKIDEKGKCKLLILKTYLQKDNGKFIEVSIARFDSNRNKVEEVFYSYDTRLITAISKIYYDSLNRKLLYTKTEFGQNTIPVFYSFRNYYGRSGLLEKVSMIDSWRKGDTTTTFKYYDADKKILTEKTCSNSPIIFQGITHYFYNKNRLIKQVDYDLTDKEIQSHDSIVYTNTSKTIYRYHFLNKISDKTVMVLKDNKPVKQLDYRRNNSGVGLYLTMETKYTYNRLDSLATKSELFYEHTEMCGMRTPKQERNYKYVYVEE